MNANQVYSHRRASCKIYVTDKAGMPVSNQKLSLKQTNHEFLFGCGAFDTIPYVNDDPQADKEFLKDRVDKWLALYNYGTLPFYLGKYEPEEGKPEETSRMNAAKFLNSHNVKVKGHPLCWHTACADWLMEYDNKTILEKQLKYSSRYESF